MADGRKYREDEVGEIFALAASADGADLPAIADPEGLTLGELQAVGREVGLAPERVAEAAATLDARADTLSHRASLGAPVSVGRVVELPRSPTDHEWQVLVTEMRETFGVDGHLTSHGETRQWTSRNLHAYLEPTEAGHRLRLAAGKRFARRGAVVGGAVGLGMCIVLFGMLDSSGPIRVAFTALIPSLLVFVGGGAVAGNFLRLRRWAADRKRQMEHIAGRARALLEAPAAEDDPKD